MKKITKSKGFQCIFHVFLILLVITPYIVSVQIGMNFHNNSSPLDYMTESAENPVLNLTFTTLTDLDPKSITSNSMIAGDHVLVRAEWTATVVNRSRLEINAPAIPSTLLQDLHSPITEIDTRYLGNNATCSITATAYLTNGSIIVQNFQQVYIGNFFIPKVTVIFPNGGEEWVGRHNITWNAYDANIADTLRFEVAVSNDAGATYQVLSQWITRKWFEWNTTPLDQLDTYLVRIRVTDGIYFSYDQSDNLFTAGEITPPPTTTTFPTTPTTTTTIPTTTTITNTIEPRVLAFIVILLVTSAVMALVVYYASRKWF